MRLVALAVVLVAAVLGVQVAQGGGDFVPLKPADPCAAPADAPAPEQLEPLAERLVVTGLANAACELGVTRERLVLDVAAGARPAALEPGLLKAVDEIPLPKVSALLPEALELTDLPGLAKDAIGAIPDGVVDELLPTDAVLRRAVTSLDVETLDLEDPVPALRDAILDAAVAEVRDRLPL